MLSVIGKGVLALTVLAALGSPAIGEDSTPSREPGVRAGVRLNDVHDALSGDPAADPAVARGILAKADTLFAQQRSDSALLLLDLVRDGAGRRGERALALEALFRRGRILATLGRAVPAEAALSTVLEDALLRRDTLRTCQALHFLAYAVGLQGRNSESAVLWGRLLDLALEREDRSHEAYARLGLAYTTMLEGWPAAARRGYERAVALFRASGNAEYELIALTGLGRCMVSLGDLEEGRSCYREVAERSAAIHDPYTEADARNNLGVIEALIGDPAAAVGHYERAVELKLANGNPEGSIVPATNSAIALAELGRYEDAASVLDRAREICERERYLDREAMILEALATVRRHQERFTEAAALYRRALALGGAAPAKTTAESIEGLAVTLAFMDSTEAGLEILTASVGGLQPGSPPETSARLERTIGELLLELGRGPEALHHLRDSERAARRAGLGFELPGILALTGRAWLLLDRPDSAYTALARASMCWESSRSRSTDPEWRERMGTDGRALYASLAHVLLEIPAGVPEPERIRAAFDALQRFKARTLRERITGPARSDSAGPAGAGEPGGPAVTVRQLQECALGERELLLDAFLGTRESFVFAVDRRECRVLRIPGIDQGLGTRLARYGALLAQKPPRRASPADEELLESATSGLGDLLLVPFADMVRQCDRVVIAPDGPLNLIPFGTLPYRDPVTGKVEPLLVSREVARIASASLLADLRGCGSSPPMRRPDHSGADGSVLTPRILAVAGAPAGPGRRLEGAEAEVRALARSYAGVEAGPAGSGGLAADLGRYDVLHFAAHTHLDDDRPWRSGIAGLPRGGTEEDSILRASRIASMRLPARLAVLSGCESARGRVLSGEGVLGLTAAFAAAGVPAVVSTLWPVDDRVTAAFMDAFYRSLARSQTVSGALRTAQLRIRRDSRTLHPFYWAGFVVVGDGDVRVALTPRHRRVGGTGLRTAGILACAGFGLIVGFGIARRRRRKVSR